MPRERAAEGCELERGLRRSDDHARLAGVPIAGIAGDQQAALFGQMCIAPGLAKNTYGTGCFMLQNTGTQCRRLRGTSCSRRSPGRLATRREYALEGSVFIGGAVVQWLRDGLGIIRTAARGRGARGSRAGQRRRLSRARVRRAGRAALGSLRARRDGRLDARHDGGRTSPAPRSRASPSRRPTCSTRCRRMRASRCSELRVDGGAAAQRSADAVPGRHARRAGGAARGYRNDGARRGLSRRAGGRLLEEPRRDRLPMARRSALRTGDGASESPVLRERWNEALERARKWQTA